MVFSKALYLASKGNLRCFECHRVCSARDGNWHDRENRQVFLCKNCERVQRDSEKKLVNYHGIPQNKIMT